MRTKLEMEKLEETKLASTEQPARYENKNGESFLYVAGKLARYTDTRVINEFDDRLVNLREDPFREEYDA